MFQIYVAFHVKLTKNDEKLILFFWKKLEKKVKLENGGSNFEALFLGKTV
jgi:hypothetical protein